MSCYARSILRAIPQRELRNNVSQVLRDVAAGESLTVTVRGRPVAELTPVRADPGPRRLVPREDVLRAFREMALDDQALRDFASDIAHAIDGEAQDPWP